jgi:hypothetical protein
VDIKKFIVSLFLPDLAQISLIGVTRDRMNPGQRRILDELFL